MIIDREITLLLILQRKVASEKLKLSEFFLAV